MRTHTKETSKSVLLTLCVGSSPVTGELSAQMASNGEKFPIDDVIMLRFGINVPSVADLKCLVYVSLTLLMLETEYSGLFG